MRQCVFDGTDQRGLPIIPTGAPDTRPLRRARCAPVRANDQSRAQGFAGGQGQHHGIGLLRLRGYGVA